MKKNRTPTNLISHTQPLVSVICLCYNHEDFVIETLESVLLQTYKNVELIIVDDCSKDTSRTIIEKWNTNNIAKHVIFNDQNLGMTKAFNKGISLAKGKYIIDLAADDVLHPNSIENHIANFKKNNFKIGVSYGNAESIDKNSNHIEYRYPVNKDFKVIDHPGEGDLYAKILERFFISSPSLMTHIEVYKKLNGYDPNLFFEDFDFLVRSSRLYPFFFCDTIVIQKRVLKNSMSSSIFERNKGAYLHRKTFFKIYVKAFTLNKTRQENIALVKRLLRELKICLKLLYFNYFLLTGVLIVACGLKHLFLKEN